MVNCMRRMNRNEYLPRILYILMADLKTRHCSVYIAPEDAPMS